MDVKIKEKPSLMALRTVQNNLIPPNRQAEGVKKQPRPNGFNNV